MAVITLNFRDDVPLAALATVLGAVDRFDVRVSSLLTPASKLWFDLFAADIPITRQKLSNRIRAHERFDLEAGTRARVVRARFDSPGFITVDGSGALEKIIDILHQGKLAKEETQAIIERIRAETELIKAKAAKENVEALSGAISVFKALGLSNEQIVKLISRDHALVKLLGVLVAEIEAAQTAGVLQRGSQGSKDDTGPF